jgi:3-oxoacyl-[acyl-carrier protein] reductase
VGRSVLVTGGNRGIGLAIAQAFAKQGDNVAVTHRGSGAPGGLLGVRCDVTDVESVDAAFTEVEAAHGPVQVLISNAGITDDTLLMRMADEQFTRVLDANLSGAYRVAKRAARGMLRARGGRMIFISSVVGLSGAPGQANYAASKAGLIGMTKTVAAEVARKNVTVNAVAPGFIETDMTAGLTNGFADAVPARRAGKPEEVAACVTFLASDAASYVTGSTLYVDGGLAA